MRRVNDSVETVNAAATAIVSAESRVQPVTIQQKRRWGTCWSGYWCFGSPKHGKRIGHAALAPEPTTSGTSAAATESSAHPTTVVLPFIAPPSSPASFLQSEPPSSTQSPVGFLSFTSLSANVYSPGPKSIFAIGPYAHETQLVSPPVFSTFTTEPSTAPFTPPPEPLHQTTPSSPEVPFAQLLTSSLDASRRNSSAGQKFPPSHYEFQSYYLYPGSPVGHLISPSSVISNSGTSSPFIMEQEFTTGGHPFLEFRTGEPPKLWSIDGFSTHKWGPYQGSGSITPDAVGPTYGDSFLLENQISEVASLANSDNGSQNNDIVIDHRVSFELTAKETTNNVEKGPVASVASIAESLSDSRVEGTVSDRDEHSSKAENTGKVQVGNTSSGETIKDSESENKEPRNWIGQEPFLTSMGSVKEFKFVNPDEEIADKPPVSSDWWANEKVVAKEAGAHNWTFFPMMQPGIS
ncbi:hypothetical protein AQUCO_01300276v1 [Aquilegia coerulea]|uniref:Hydroxyproline-rich glycoprotein family protein n=1 Tax=Aquilegia coerulea TaxID=218851 RepID=A0A2G5E0M7_AQUCA|nr:hypothetical protein AQUCO_01300276v1 [Aquilegia coerulea]